MADIGRIITTGAKTKVGKEFTKTLVEGAQSIIKTGKTTEATKLLQKKKTPVKVGEKETQAVKGAETVVNITKKDIKVKKPEVSAAQADEFIDYLKGSKIPKTILRDFNFNKITSSDDIKKLIQMTSQSMKGQIDKQTRGVQTEEITKRLATLIGKNEKDLTRTLLELKPGQTLNAEYILAARELLVAGMTKLDNMAKRITDVSRIGKVTDDERLAFRQHFALMGEFQKVIKGVQTETARALQQFRIPTRQKKYSSVDLDNLNKEALMIELGGGDNIQKVAKLYIEAGSETARLKFSQGAGSFKNLKKASDSIAEVFLNVILSNPVTHIRNSAGNWITMGINNFERKYAANLQPRWLGGKSSEGIAEFEDYAKVFGKTMAAQEMQKAIGEAISKGGWKNFFKNFDTQIQSNFGGTSKIELFGKHLTAENWNATSKFGKNTIDGIGNILTLGRVPTRFLTVMDNWFKNQEYRSELYALAYRETMQMWREGWLKQNDMAAYLADRVVNPTKAIQEAAYDGAHYVSYQWKLSKQQGNKLAEFGNLLQKGKTKSSFMSWMANYYLPFIQTPTNIASFAAERTPILASFLSRYQTEIAAGGARAQMAKARLQLGYMFYSTMGTAGYFSGAFGGSDIQIPGATTGGKRELMKGFGYQPNSIRVPIGEDEYAQFNLTGFDPLSFMVSMAGNSGQAIHLALQSGADPEALAQAAMAMTYGFGEILSNGTYMQGVGNFQKDLTNIGKFMAGDRSNRGLQKWWNRFSASFVPGAFKWVGKNMPHLNEEGSIAWFNDDLQKQAVEWNEFLLRNINEENLEYDYNIFGERIEKFGFYSKIKKTDVSRAVEEVMPDIRPIKDNIQYTYAKGLSVQIPLNSEQLRFYKKNAGINFTDIMKNRVFKNPLWQPDTEEIVKKKLITTALSDARALAKDQLLNPENGFLEDLQSKGDELKIKKILKEQGGKPIINDNFGIIDDDNINNNNQE